MAFEIFISYRRKDVGGYAGRLYDHLVMRYGRELVLFDVQVEGTAERLEDWVKRVVPESAVQLVLIGCEWLETPEGRRRLEEDGDIVRLEIELALRTPVPIIPILIDGAAFPIASALPRSIAALADFKGYELANSQWEQQIDLLAQAIESVINTHLIVLNRGVEYWSEWRQRNPRIKPTLAATDLADLKLAGGDFTGVDLSGARLERTLLDASDLKSANLAFANLREAKLRGARLTQTDLTGADLSGVDLGRADLDGANLKHTKFNGAKLKEARISNCEVYGVSAWGTDLSNALQENLSVHGTSDENTVTVDDIQSAVVIHTLLVGGGARQVIEAITKMSVLILGRFTSERKAVLDTLFAALRQRNYVPLLFDFQRPATRDFNETISLLAHLSRFVIADLTDAKNVADELGAVVPSLPSLPIQPIILASQTEPAMFGDFLEFPWVLPTYRYDSTESLLASLDETVIAPALEKSQEIAERRRMFTSLADN